MSRSLAIYLFALVIISGQELFVNGDVYWRDYDGTIPSDAYSTGYNTFIAQVVVIQEDGVGLIPGTFYPDTNVVVTEHNGYIEVKDNIKLLCTSKPQSLKWQPVNTDELDEEFLKKCVVGGHDFGVLDLNLYIGKVIHQNQWRCGKVLPLNSGFTGLYVWSNDETTYVTQDFEILMRV